MKREDLVTIVSVLVCFVLALVCLSHFLAGCVPPDTLPKPTVPKPPPDEIVRPVEGEPIVVDDIKRCMNVPPAIECRQNGEKVLCETPCGSVNCNPGAWILCPTGLCYTADP